LPIHACSVHYRRTDSAGALPDTTCYFWSFCMGFMT
jgi:hypothetical protein